MKVGSLVVCIDLTDIDLLVKPEPMVYTVAVLWLKGDLICFFEGVYYYANYDLIGLHEVQSHESTIPFNTVPFQAKRFREVLPPKDTEEICEELLENTLTLIN